MKQLINSTTALTLSLALAVPHNLAAQGEPPVCNPEADVITFPCSLDGQVITGPGALKEALRAAAAPAETAQEERQIAGDAAAAEAERQAAEQAAAAEAERQAAEQAAAAEAERQAAEQAAAAEAERQAAEQVAAAEAERQAAEQAAAAEAERQAAEQAAAAEAERQAAEQAAAAAERQQFNQTDAAVAERQAAERAEAEAAALEEQRRAARAEELAAAAAAAAAAEAGQSDAEVVTEEVTEEAVRSSNEEFATAVTGDQQAETRDDGGLSKFEKALLLGLGAVVVGSVLKNGDRVVSNSGDRVVVEDPSGDLRVLKDDDALLRRPGDEVRTETFNDGSSRTVVNKPDGSQIITIRGRDGRVLRRVSVDPQGNQYVLFDDLQEEERIVVTDLPRVEQNAQQLSATSDDALRAALMAEMTAQELGRFSLRQVREIREVRSLAPELELDAVRFETGSAAIRPEQARSLAKIGRTLSELIARDPRTVILVEGHTDAVGSATYNLALSDRRAETVALALTEYFGVPPENMITQGYGESALKVPTLDAEPANRRAVVRNITALLR
ncbi:OmpA family protein [Marimonas sp. MJW-29]|uniref:OmpA family protein n=1 Tax=Sulfitobacter sediminis TaxID=3234186 RepID=A0ABV3RKJ8_9RHOB